MRRVLVVAAVPQELRDFRPDSSARAESLVTGMGGRRSGQAVKRRLWAGGVDLVVSAGFAGGARPGFEVGDLVMASEVIDAHSQDRRRPDPSLLTLGGGASIGPFVTVDRVLSQPQAKSDLGTRFGAIAVDMESAAVAQAAEEAGLPWVAVRAILDPMELPLRVGSAAQAIRLLASPGRWKELSGFLRMVRAASRSLAVGLHSLLERRG